MKRRACVCDGEPPYVEAKCQSCYAAYLRNRPGFAAKRRQYMIDWRAKGDNAERGRVKQRVRDQRDAPSAYRRYKITREEYDAFLAEPCGICGAESKHLDHDHACCPKGKGCPNCIRGALCHRCNLGVGYLEGWFMENRDAALEWIQAKLDA